MYIITDKDNVIINISKTIGYQSNGNILVNDGTLAIAKLLVNKVCEVDEIPEEIEEVKYCYTEEKGFYKNENYKEYYSNEERISSLEDVVNTLLGF